MICKWLSILLGYIYICQTEKLLVVNFLRHGARTPESWDYLPNQYEEPYGALTAAGMRQMYILGTELRRRYIDQEKFLSESYSSKEIYASASPVERTYQSLISLLNGMYPLGTGQVINNQTNYAKLNPPITIKNEQILNEDIQYAIPWGIPVFQVEVGSPFFYKAFKHKICPRIKRLNKQRIIDAVNMVAEPQLDAQIMTIKDMQRIYSAYFCNQVHGKILPNFENDLLEQYHQFRKFIFYEYKFREEQQSQLTISKFLEELKLKLTLATNNNIQQKLHIYLGHDTNLAALLRLMLSLDQLYAMKDSIPPFGSLLSFELHLENHEYIVKIIYNDNELFIQACNSSRCTLNQFIQFLDQNIIPNIEKICFIK